MRPQEYTTGCGRSEQRRDRKAKGTRQPLHARGVREDYEGELFGRQAEAMRDILDVFGEDGLTMYLVSILEGEEDAREDEAAADPDAVEGILDYETGEFTPIERGDEGEDDLLDDPDPGEEPHSN